MTLTSEQVRELDRWRTHHFCIKENKFSITKLPVFSLGTANCIICDCGAFHLLDVKRSVAYNKCSNP